MKPMQCPRNKNVKDNHGCMRCFEAFKPAVTRAACIKENGASYINENISQPKVQNTTVPAIPLEDYESENGKIIKFNRHRGRQRKKRIKIGS